MGGPGGPPGRRPGGGKVTELYGKEHVGIGWEEKSGFWGLSLPPMRLLVGGGGGDREGGGSPSSSGRQAPGGLAPSSEEEEEEEEEEEVFR